MFVFYIFTGNIDMLYVHILSKKIFWTIFCEVLILLEWGWCVRVCVYTHPSCPPSGRKRPCSVFLRELKWLILGVCLMDSGKKKKKLHLPARRWTFEASALWGWSFNVASLQELEHNAFPLTFTGLKEALQPWFKECGGLRRFGVMTHYLLWDQ